MYQVKSKIFLDLTKTQKSALCNSLRALTKKFLDLSADEITQKFIEDEQYYIELHASKFEFLKDFIDDEKFISQVKRFICECLKFYEYK